MKNTFGTTLRSLMRAKGLSGRALARELGIHYKTLQEWQGPGARMPRDPEVIRRLADYFQCTTHFLLFGEEDPRAGGLPFADPGSLHVGTFEVTVRRK